MIDIKSSKDIVSIVKNVVFLDIETSGLEPTKSEILEIGAVKIDDEGGVSIFDSTIKNKLKVTPEIFSLCKNLSQDELSNSPSLNMIKGDFLKFIEDKTIICHNKSFEMSFLNYHIGNIENKFIDSMELAAVLEPYHSEFNLEYLKRAITLDDSEEIHRALSDAIDTVNVVNALILRFKDSLEKTDKLTLYPLSFEIDSYLNKFQLPNWDWSEYINNANFSLKDKTITKYINFNNQVKIDTSKEKEMLKLLKNHGGMYENLLKEEGIWNSKKGFIYEFRPGQYELTKLIRETFNNIKHNISCIEAPTGIGKSVGYLLPAVLESVYFNKRIIISTATKELQVQLIDKDLPNVINSLGLDKKVSYGYIKGKNNYICKSKFEEYKKEYTSENPTNEEILSIIIIENLIKDGKYGDKEEINYWLTKHFPSLQSHLYKVSCEADLCKPKLCKENCIYKKRIEELKTEDITVVNHSLLAKWPYTDEKPLENIIVDEAHNLAEKGYDFFSSEIEYKSFKYFLRDIYPSEFLPNSKYRATIKDSKKRKIKTIDKFYNEISLSRDTKAKISTKINFILENMDEILEFGLKESYNLLSNYDLSWELNLQQDEEIGRLRKNTRFVSVTYKAYSSLIKYNLERILLNISEIVVLLDKSVDDDLVDKESDVFKYGKLKIKDLKEYVVLLEKLLEYEENDLNARIVTVSSEFDNFLIRLVPLNLNDLFMQNILSILNNGVFVSATLSVDNSMDYFTRTLGINRVQNNKMIINPIYDYKNRVQIVKITDLAGYQSLDFTKDMAKTIDLLSKTTNSNILALFNNKKRQQETYDLLIDSLHRQNTSLYMDKKGIKSFKNLDTKSVVLGSKGCFEGVDVPGDGLTCVTLDKLPNINPKDPLYFSIMKRFNKSYMDVNYPQMIIKVKQALGRLLRSKYDYGVFVVFDMGKKDFMRFNLEKNLHNCKIENIKSENINTYIGNNIIQNRKEVIESLMKDIIKTAKFRPKDLDLVDYMNIEIKKRSIKANVKYSEAKENKLIINYYDKKYYATLTKKY